LHLISLLEASGIEVEGHLTDVAVTSVVGHSEDISGPGALLVTTAVGPQLKALAEIACARGAVGIIAPESGGDHNVPILRCDKPRRALASASRVLYGPPGPFPLLAVTGTNGKSTTCAAAASILRSQADQDWLAVTTVGVISRSGVMELGSNGPQTTPRSDQLWGLVGRAAAEGMAGAVLEASSHGLEQERLHGFRFDVAGFTGLDTDHLEYHGSREKYLDAKKILFQQCDLAVVRSDVDGGEEIEQSARCPVLTFGVGSGSHPTWLRLVDFVPRVGGSRCDVEIDGSRYVVSLKTQSRTIASNLVLATGMAVCAGMEIEGALHGAEQFEGLPGRFEAVDQCGPKVIVDYAHTPGAMQSVLGDARALTTRELWVVFGAGGDRDALKRPLMGMVAGELADHVVVTSDNPRSENPAAIAEAIEQGRSGNATWYRELDRAEAIKFALAQADEEDVVLIAGKGHEVHQEIGGASLPFSDQKVAMDYVRCVHRELDKSTS
jgi:UDP-N-acetylmuramoyl-L-alanyl-D-glutamate--2,6-diaminopimelate ligase